MSAHPLSARDLARALIRCPSVTPKDAGALALLENVLKAAGFATTRVTFSEPGTPDVDNLYARIGTGAPYLVFAGHTDVVPPGDRAHWRFDPFAAEVADGMIFGRGASDMKGAVAAFAAAAAAYVAEQGTIERLDRLSDHRRRGRSGHQRHGQASRLGAGARRTLRPLSCGRADQRFKTLGDTIKIGRRGSLNGQARRARRARPCRLSATRRQSDPASPAPARRADCHAARSGHARISSRRTSKS